MKNKKFVIAIDGPVGSGKGTLGVALAKKLNALYFYTGGMYRALALLCLRKKIDLQNQEKVLDILKGSNIYFETSITGINVFLDNENINNKIFLPEVTRAVPIISAHPKIREEMVKRQREMTKGQSAVIEGRDAATKVAPDADIKIYLTADLEVRAKRRCKQLFKGNVKKTFEEVLKDTQERDRLDMEREASPLTIAPDADVIDTTNLTVDETVKKAMEKIEEKGIYERNQNGERN